LIFFIKGPHIPAFALSFLIYEFIIGCFYVLKALVAISQNKLLSWHTINIIDKEKYLSDAKENENYL
jgi:hypothetical protein